MNRILLPPSGHLANSNHVARHPADHGTWIWHPGKAATETAVLRFYLRFSLESAASPLIHVTADQRFQLRYDGHDVTFGPDRCDLEHWTVQSVRIDLAAGKHEVEALAWYLPEPDGTLSGGGNPARPPMAQVTWRGGFLLCAEEIPPALLNTGEAAWTVEDLTGAIEFRRPQIPGYHDIGPEFRFDLGRWRAQNADEPATVRLPLESNHGVRRPGWCLHPARLPEQDRQPWAGGQVRAVRTDWSEAPWRSEEANAAEITRWQTLLGKGGEMTIPPHTRVSVLWDFEDYRCGYPALETGGSMGAEIEWGWAEAMYQEADPKAVTELSHKGHRGEIVGKVFVGIVDRWRLANEAVAPLPTLWWRSGRYVRLRVQTAGEALTLKHLGLVTTGYPFGEAARWQSSDADWDRLMPLFARAFRSAGHETWTDTPYYEQMGYVGDNVLTCLANYALFPDAGLSRRAVELFDWSRRASGLVAERYPSGWRQESPTFSLLWPTMVRDYAWWRDDPWFVRACLPGLRAMLAEFDGLAGDDGLLHQLPGWPFIDWVPEWNVGCGPGVREGDSSIVNLHWVRALLAAAQIEEAFGDVLLARRNGLLAEGVFRRIIDRYWDRSRSLLLDTVGCDAASEHGQAFALMTGLLEPEKSATCLAALRGGSPLTRATIYGSFYVLEALWQHEAGDELHKRLEGWRSLPDLGFTSTPEQPEPTRSDAHAWGAHPAWHTLASIAGVRPAAPGFARVRVRPCPGALTFVAGSVFHPRGEVAFDLHFGVGTVRGEVVLPGEVSGEFVWHEEVQTLKPGRNTVGVSATRLA